MDNKFILYMESILSGLGYFEHGRDINESFRPNRTVYDNNKIFIENIFKSSSMPVRIKKVNGGYRVSTPSGVKAKHTTKAKAKSQARLLRGVEHGWRPTKKK